MVNAHDLHGGSGKRVLGRAQRVRDGREHAAGGPRGAACSSTAYLWHNYGKSTIGSRERHRARAGRQPARLLPTATTSPTTPCWSSPASSIRRRRSRSSARPSARLPRPTRKLAPTYTVEPVQDGERTVTLRRTGDVRVVGLVYHGVAGPRSRLRGRGGARRHPDRTSRRAACTRRWSSTGLAAEGRGRRASRSTEPGRASSCSPRCAPSKSLEEGARQDDRDRRGPGQAATSPTRTRSSACKTDALKEIELRPDRLRPASASSCRSGRRRATGASSSCIRDASRRSIAADVQQRGAAVPQGVEPHRRPVHPDQGDPIARRCRGAGRDGDGQELQGLEELSPGRGVRRHRRRTSRSAPSARRCRRG